MRLLQRKTLVNGNLLAQEVMEKMKGIIEGRPKGVPPPKLGIVLDGNNHASEAYVRKKMEAAQKIGMEHILLKLKGTEQVLQAVKQLNLDPSCHGFIVQLPLSDQQQTRNILQSIDVAKDVDCLHPQNLQKVLQSWNLNNILPCTCQAIEYICQAYGVDPAGKKTVVIGKSQLVGLPVAAMFRHKNAKIVVFDRESDQQELIKAVGEAEIVVSAAGQSKLIRAAHQNSILFDVGFSRQPNSNIITGDIDIKEIKQFQLYTPVPGGIGPLTVSMLLQNVLNNWQKLYNL